MLLTLEQRNAYIRQIDEHIHRVKQRLNQYTTMKERAYTLGMGIPGDDIWLGPAAARFHLSMRHIGSTLFGVHDDLLWLLQQLNHRREALEKLF